MFHSQYLAMSLNWPSFHPSFRIQVFHVLVIRFVILVVLSTRLLILVDRRCFTSDVAIVHLFYHFHLKNIDLYYFVTIPLKITDFQL